MNEAPVHGVMIIVQAFRVVLIGLVSVGCQSPSPGAPPPATPAPAPAPPAPPPYPERPASADLKIAAAGCDVVFAVAVSEGGAVEVTAHNQGATDVDIELPDRCPAGPVSFDGLGSAYDYYGTCNMGACPSLRPPETLRLPPGARTLVATTAIDVRGGPCNQPLAAGRYTLGIAPPPTSRPACVRTAVLEVTVPRPAPPAPVLPIEPSPEQTQPRPPAPAKQPNAQGDVHACTDHGDCEIFCPRVQGCCGFPCGCKNAINRAHRDEFTRQYAATCQRHPNCPAMGCAYESAPFARCENGRCVPGRF